MPNATAEERPELKLTEQDIAEMRRHVDIRIKADKIWAKMRPEAPDPVSIQHLYKPMTCFKRYSCGEIKIKKEVVSCSEATSIRHALMLGTRRVKIQFSEPVTFHRLLGPDKQTMTSDLPVEIYSQYISFQHMTGNVLVGGLGLGMAARMIVDMGGVKSVTVVEKNPDVIKLVKDQALRGTSIDVVEADLFDYLSKVKEGQFDSAYYDIWYQTGEGVWGEMIVPLYRMSRFAGIHNLGSWGDYEMNYQLAPVLYQMSKIEERHARHFQPYWVFVQGLKKVLGGHPPYPTKFDRQIVKLIKQYLYEIGTKKWEDNFPWNAWGPELRKGRA